MKLLANFSHLWQLSLGREIISLVFPFDFAMFINYLWRLRKIWYRCTINNIAIEFMTSPNLTIYKHTCTQVKIHTDFRFRLSLLIKYLATKLRIVWDFRLYYTGYIYCYRPLSTVASHVGKKDCELQKDCAFISSAI